MNTNPRRATAIRLHEMVAAILNKKNSAVAKKNYRWSQAIDGKGKVLIHCLLEFFWD